MRTMKRRNKTVTTYKMRTMKRRNKTVTTYKMRTMKRRKKKTFLMIQRFSTERRQWPRHQSE
jgi:hypothetical protein